MKQGGEFIIQMMGLLLAVFPLLGVAVSQDEIDGNETWAGIKSHPAVINSLRVAEPENVVSWAGEWEFAAITGFKRTPRKPGSKGSFYCAEQWDTDYFKRIYLAYPLRTIMIPGVWEAQGVGEEGLSDCWIMADNGQSPIRHKFMGEGWYRRRLEIPAAWKGRRIWLKIGGVRGLGHFWVNDNPVARINDFCATRKYEITSFVKPGEFAKFVAEIDNRAPTSSGCLVCRNRWGGFFRTPEIESTPVTFIDDAWIRGDFAARQAEVSVRIDGPRTKPFKLRVEIEGRIVEQSVRSAGTSKDYEIINVPLSRFRPWSPEHPDLYWAKIELLEEGKVVHTRYERFGVRKLEVRGGDFYLNEKPFYMRGFGDDNVYPLTGMTIGDRDFHREHLRKARQAGFNQVRTHTHCEVPEYFEAADELGIVVQPELPYYCDTATEYGMYDPLGHLRELYENYRRYASFLICGMGNEGSHGKWLDRRLYRLAKELGPDGLVISQSGYFYGNDSECSDYEPAHQEKWEGTTTLPCAKIDRSRPFTIHEYLNLCVKADYRDESDYTGVWLPLETAAKRTAFVTASGLDLIWGERLQDAQIALQRVWQKEGVEKARRDRDCDGSCFWTIVDVGVYNPEAETYSAQGLFDPFWRPKRGGFSPEEFAVFNSASCILVDTPITNRVYRAGDAFAADVLFAHYGEDPLPAAWLDWRFVADGKVLCSDRIGLGAQALGAARKVCDLRCRVPPVERACKATLEVVLRANGADVAGNSYEHWFFPKSSLDEVLAEASKRGVTVAPEGSDDAKVAGRENRPSVIISGANGKPNVRLGWWWMGQQVGLALKSHPALKYLPHEGHLSPLLFRIVKEGLPLPAEGISSTNAIVVGEGAKTCYSYLSELKVGRARVMRVDGLDLLSDTPEGNAILKGLVEDVSDR